MNDNLCNFTNVTEECVTGLCYSRVHFYLASVVCAFGASANGISIWVFTRPHMRSTFNFLLLYLTCSDFLTMLGYTVLILCFTLSPYIENSCGPLHLLLTYRISTWILSALHTFSMWTVVIIATFRAVGVVLPLSARKLCSRRHSTVAIALVALFSILFEGIDIGFHMVKPFGENNTEIFIMGYDLANHPQARDVMFWTKPVMSRMLPCSIIVLLTGTLIVCLRRSMTERSRLTTAQNRDATETNTIVMLLAIVIVFVACELPQAILLVADYAVYHKCRYVMHLLTLINCASNFAFYCSINKNYRQTFRRAVCCGGKRRTSHGTDHFQLTNVRSSSSSRSRSSVESQQSRDCNRMRLLSLM